MVNKRTVKFQQLMQTFFYKKKECTVYYIVPPRVPDSYKSERKKITIMIIKSIYCFDSRATLLVINHKQFRKTPFPCHRDVISYTSLSFGIHVIWWRSNSSSGFSSKIYNTVYSLWQRKYLSLRCIVEFYYYFRIYLAYASIPTLSEEELCIYTHRPYSFTQNFEVCFSATSYENMHPLYVIRKCRYRKHSVETWRNSNFHCVSTFFICLECCFY